MAAEVNLEQYLIGMNIELALEAAQTTLKYDFLRHFDENQAITCEYKPRRFNIQYDSKTQEVTEVFWG